MCIRDRVIAVIGVPPAADIGLLGFRLADLRNFRVPAIGREIFVDVDLAPAAGESDMLFGGERLIAHEEDAVLGDGLPLSLIHI